MGRQRRSFPVEGSALGTGKLQAVAHGADERDRTADLLITVRPGKAGRRGMEGCDVSMKLRLSSSGCKTRPARGEPAQPVASLAPFVVTRAAKRRYASVWAVGISLETLDMPGAEGVVIPEGDGERSVKWARSVSHPAGSWTTARRKRTAQAPGRPSFSSTRSGATENPVTPSPTPSRRRTARLAAKKSVRIEVGHRQGEPEPRPTGRGSRRAAK